MSTEAIGDMEYQLRVRAGCHQDNLCPECEAVRRQVDEIELRSHLQIIWDEVRPWAQVVLVWLGMVLVLWQGPRLAARFGLWLSQ